jgi:hypothetical protein
MKSRFDPPPHVTRFAVLLDMAAVSDQAGEAETALRKLIEHVRKTRLRGADFCAAMVDRDRALDLVNQYAARLDQLETENKRLRANGHGGGTLAQALWQDAGMPSTVESRHAQWALAIEGQGLIHLTAKETSFLNSCARRSRLSEAQRSWLTDIIRTAIARTGQAPPP